jgi:hypothetical protein
MAIRALAGVTLLLLWAGCGGSSTEGDADAEPKPTGTARSSAEEEVAAIAERYMRAVAAQDWAAACDTRSRRERRSLARTGGTCERTLEAVFRGKPVDLFKDAKARDVRIRGEIAGVDMHQPGQAQPAATLAAVLDVDGRWRLQDTEASQTP